METQTFLVIAAFVVAYAVVSRRIETTVLTAPMVFAGFGMIACPSVLGLVELTLDDEIVYVIAEVTLALILFTDASRIDLRALRREAGVPVRMLGIGMPLVIALGALLALTLLGDLSIWEALLLAAILAPTDAALGQAVIVDERVPVAIRQAINVESGLNDGLALPAVFFFAACAAGGSGEPPVIGHGVAFPEEWWTFIALQLVLGPLTGAGVGLFGGWLIHRASKAGWVSHSYEELAGPAMALLAFAAANFIGGNGFIAAFVAGLVAGAAYPKVADRFHGFAEAEGDLLVLISFMLFGALMVWPAFDALNWRTAVYAVLSLTIVRMLPVALSLLGYGLRTPTLLFLGWFGPRGLASIIFGLLVVSQTAAPHAEQIFHVVSITVLISVFAHGITATPAAGWYGRFTSRHCSGPESPEQCGATEHRIRARARSWSVDNS